MKQCEVVQDLLPLYVDGLASGESARLIEEHVEFCPQCAAILDRLRAPLAQESGADAQVYVSALEKQKHRQRRRVILICILAVFFCMAVFCICMEVSYNDQTLVLSTTDEDKIAQECGEIRLTMEEYELAHEVFRLPEIQALFGTEDAEPPDILEGVVPSGATELQVDIFSHAIYIDYQYMGCRVLLSYLDADGSGYTDRVTKTISVTYANLEPGTIYQLEYWIGDEMPTYEKYITKHVWFSWIKVLQGELQVVLQEERLHAGLNAEIVEIDAANQLIYVKDADENGVEIFGARCALDCSKAVENDVVIYVDFETAEVWSIHLDDLKIGDEVTLNLYDSEYNNARMGSAVIEQLQLMTQRPIA